MNKQIMLDLKERSHKKVFALIRAQGNVSGAALAKQMEMQPSSLVYILRHLKDKTLIRVSGYGNSTDKGGKRPLLWQVNPEYGNIIGLEVMRHSIRAVVVNLAGDILMKVEKEFSPDRTEKTIKRILTTIFEVLNEISISKTPVLYISLAVPGIVNPVTHRIIYSFGLKLEDFDLKSFVEERFNIPTGVINDANAGALGEQWFNKGESFVNNILYIMYNPLAGGMGLGVVLNQKLYTGSNGIAGEIFSRVPSLEQIINEKSNEIPKEEILIPLADGIKNIQISDLYNFSKKGCPLSKAVLTGLSKQVAKEISKITGLFDPERITLGGDLSICENLCCDEIMTALRELLEKNYPFKIQIPQVEYAKTKIFSAATGATALFLSDELSL
ncbi:MAG: ROK family protein [Bacteroidetes bacterium]|nr:MAG: ROK family protein [Bacteroidota bacterium]